MPNARRSKASASAASFLAILAGASDRPKAWHAPAPFRSPSRFRFVFAFENEKENEKEKEKEKEKERQKEKAKSHKRAHPGTCQTGSVR